MEIKKNFLFTLFVFICFFFLYVFFSPPGIVFGDSPELILASYTLGISHPPGYPLYSLLTKAYHFIVFFLSYAKACNIFSAFISSISLFFFFQILLKLEISPLISLLATITLGFSEVYFKQSIISEVYSLNNFFFVVSLYLMVSYYKNRDKRLIFLAFFLVGVGLANHHTLLSILAINVLFYLILFERDLKITAVSFLFFIFGLTVYLYLPLRSSTNPAIDWGDPENLGSFLAVILRKQFGLGSGERSYAKFVSQVSNFSLFLNDQLFIILILLMFIGIYFMLRNEKRFFVFLLVFLINGVFTPIFLNSTDDDFFLVKEFLTPSVITAIIFVAYGIKFISFKKWFKYVYFFVFIFTLVYKFYYDIDLLNKRNDNYAYKLAVDSLKGLPKDSFVIGESDYTLFPLWFVQIVDGVRRDVTVLDADFLMLPWYQKQNIKKLPILKEIIPDISSHSSSRKGSALDDAVLEGFKLDQTELLVKNINQRLGKEVFFTYDFYEMAKFYKPQLLKFLNQFGLVYHIGYEKKLLSNEVAIDLSHLSSKINLNKEELIFLTPYIPYMIEKADMFYKNFDTKSAISYLSNAFLISPSPEKAIYLAYVLADEGKKIERAEQLLYYAEKNSMVVLPKQNLVKGLILLRKNRLNDAYVFLNQEEKINPNQCDSKIFLLELFSRKGDLERVKIYLEEIKKSCDDYYLKRAGRILKNP